MQKTLQILLICFSLLLALFLFGQWLPQKIVAKRHLLPDASREAVVEADTVEVISQDLITYIEEEKLKSNENSDVAFEDELLKKLEEFHKDYMKSSNDFLKDRFAQFEYPLDNADRVVEVPPGLEDVVQFWVHIFGVYDKDQVVFYHQDDVGIVYSVLDFKELKTAGGSSVEALKGDILADEALRLRKMISRVAQAIKNQNQWGELDESEQRLFNLLLSRQDVLELSEEALLEKFTYRFGFAHRMKQAIALSTRYMPHIQNVLRERGLPEVLSGIPFVESAFNLKAYSSAGAAGIWQFIEATGKQYLKIDEYVDERFDPVLSTYAAASHLAREYAMLGSWPLTINAYNTGPGRVMKAMEQLGTKDIAVIIKKFKGSGYGFDSRNYFPEVLAAFEVYKNREKYFGDLPQFESENSEYVMMPANINLQELIEASSLNRDLFLSMNTAIRPQVLSGEKPLPKGYFVKVPANQKENVQLTTQELAINNQYLAYHIVKRGEDLSSIAQKYGVSEEALTTANSFLPGQKIKKGEVLKLPADFVATQPKVAHESENVNGGDAIEQKIKEWEEEQNEVEEAGSDDEPAQVITNTNN